MISSINYYKIGFNSLRQLRLTYIYHLDYDHNCRLALKPHSFMPSSFTPIKLAIKSGFIRYRSYVYKNISHKII